MNRVEDQEGDAGRGMGGSGNESRTLRKEVSSTDALKTQRKHQRFEGLGKAIPEGRSWRSEGAGTKASLARVLTKAWNGEAWLRWWPESASRGVSRAGWVHSDIEGQFHGSRRRWMKEVWNQCCVRSAASAGGPWGWVLCAQTSSTLLQCEQQHFGHAGSGVADMTVRPQRAELQ